MSSDKNQQERITWLQIEFAEAIERCERSEINLRQLSEAAHQLTTQDEVDELENDLLQHTFWAMTHAQLNPACWAPKSKEIQYLRRCLLEEDVFDPEQVEFTIL